MPGWLHGIVDIGTGSGGRQQGGSVRSKKLTDHVTGASSRLHFFKYGILRRPELETGQARIYCSRNVGELSFHGKARDKFMHRPLNLISPATAFSKRTHKDHSCQGKDGLATVGKGKWLRKKLLFGPFFQNF